MFCVTDNCGVLKHIKKLGLDDHSHEHCAIAIAGYEDITYSLIEFCMIEDVGGNTTKNFTIIPKKISYSLINICDRENKIPVIIHTHIPGYEYSNPIRFSQHDEVFMDKFAQYVSKLGTIQSCLFIVTNGVDIMYSLYDLKNMQSTCVEEIGNE